VAAWNASNGVRLLILEKKLKKIFLLFLLALTMAGCANRLPMGIDSSTSSLDLNEKSLLLLTVDLSRKEPSRFQPVPQTLWLGTVDAAGTVTNARMLGLDGDGWISVSDDKTLYAYRVLVPEGTTAITGISGLAKAFPVIGRFYVPLRMEVPVGKPSVLYLGRVEALLRPREDNEYRAGDVIPLIDQSVTGMSSGTFDVQIKDKSATDLPLLRSTYPALASAKIETKLVPVVDREYVDRTWRGEDVSGVDPYKNSRKAALAQPVASPATTPVSPATSAAATTPAKSNKKKPAKAKPQ
jgi:hypothetical protein